MGIWDKFWHKRLGRPYYLARVAEEGQGVPIVLLHGIGRTGAVWDHVIELLRPLAVRLVALDLLGFGASPKPDWLDYDIDDHARAVIASLKQLKLGEPAILVGHSMGCLVAVRVARLRPDLVRHLVLYEMPLYEGLPEKRRYRLRTNLYFRFYKRLASFEPGFTADKQRMAERLARRVIGLEATPETWLAFTRSLKNTIMRQTAADDIKQAYAPMDVIYGSFDMLVIRGQPRQFFGERSETVKAHTIRARHSISLTASHFIVERIQAALQAKPTAEAYRQVEEAVRD